MEHLRMPKQQLDDTTMQAGDFVDTFSTNINWSMDALSYKAILFKNQH
jgi:hypothetical protein